MDLLSLLTGSENLYKYLFITGVGMIILALFYPLDKSYELSNKKDLYNKEMSLLNYEINKLKDSAKHADKVYSNVVYKYNNSKSESEKIALKHSFDSELNSLQSARNAIEIKRITVDYTQQAIITLQKHIDDYTKFEWWFYFFGTGFTIWGIIGWYHLMKKTKESAPQAVPRNTETSSGIH